MAKTTPASSRTGIPRSSLRAERWWAIPSAATIAFLIVGVTGFLKTRAANAAGMGPHKAMAVFGFFAVAICAFAALCALWAAAAYPPPSQRPGQRVRFAVLALLFTTIVFLAGEISLLQGLNR